MLLRILTGILFAAAVTLVVTGKRWYPVYLDWKILRKVTRKYSRGEIAWQVSGVRLSASPYCEMTRDEASGKWTVHIKSPSTHVPRFMLMIRELLVKGTNPLPFSSQASMNAQATWSYHIMTVETARLTVKLLNRLKIT